MTDKSLLIAEAMGYIDDRFLEEAHPEACGVTQARVDRNKMIRRIAAVACICLVALGISKFPGFNQTGSAAPEAGAPTDGIVGNTATSDKTDGNKSPMEGDAATDTTETTAETETETET